METFFTIIRIAFNTFIALAAMAVLAVLVWLAYEQLNGINPFQ